MALHEGSESVLCRRESPLPTEATSRPQNKVLLRRSGAPRVRNLAEWEVSIVRMWMSPRFCRPTPPTTLGCGIMQSIQLQQDGYGS